MTNDAQAIPYKATACHAPNAPYGPSRLAGGHPLLEPSQPPLVTWRATTQSASAMHEANYAVTAQDAVTLERDLQTSPRTAGKIVVKGRLHLLPCLLISHILMAASSDLQDPRALIVFAHSPGPEWEETKWVPPRIFLRGVAERFRAELLCCGAVNELDDQSLSRNVGIKLAAMSVQETAREDNAIPLVVLVADDEGLRSMSIPDKLALRKIITNCSTCILDLYAGNAIVSCFEGVLDGATIPRQAGCELYGVFDLPRE